MQPDDSKAEPAATLLAHLRGERPPAPQWFLQALAVEAERSTVDVKGCAIETLAWGARGAPGLLLIHGNTAHADWWSFIAPQLASTHRVAALSLSGMGNSGWRQAYSLELYAQELLAAAEHTGLFESSVKPVFVGHSFGSFALMLLASQVGERLGGVIGVDMPIQSKEQRARRAAQAPTVRSNLRPRSARVYESQAAALARFRFLPPQGCRNLFLVDHIARHSLRVEEGPQGTGWVWKFAPNLFTGFRMRNSVTDWQAARCKVGVMRGAQSSVVDDETWAFQRSLVPDEACIVDLADAQHHVMLDQPLAFVAALRELAQTMRTR